MLICSIYPTRWSVLKIILLILNSSWWKNYLWIKVAFIKRDINKTLVLPDYMKWSCYELLLFITMFKSIYENYSHILDRETMQAQSCCTRSLATLHPHTDCNYSADLLIESTELSTCIKLFYFFYLTGFLFCAYWCICPWTGFPQFGECGQCSRSSLPSI